MRCQRFRASQGEEKFGTKVEIKNINSFRYVEKAIDYEIARQITMIENGETIVQETRLWDEAKGLTRPMRSKEQAADYRYFPDPDLLPLVVDSEWVEKIKVCFHNYPTRASERKI